MSFESQSSNCPGARTPGAVGLGPRSVAPTHLLQRRGRGRGGTLSRQVPPWGLPLVAHPQHELPLEASPGSGRSPIAPPGPNGAGAGLIGPSGRASAARAGWAGLAATCGRWAGCPREAGRGLHPDNGPGAPMFSTGDRQEGCFHTSTHEALSLPLPVPPPLPKHVEQGDSDSSAETSKCVQVCGPSGGAGAAGCASHTFPAGDATGSGTQRGRAGTAAPGSALGPPAAAAAGRRPAQHETSLRRCFSRPQTQGRFRS